MVFEIKFNHLKIKIIIITNEMVLNLLNA